MGETSGIQNLPPEEPKKDLVPGEKNAWFKKILADSEKRLGDAMDAFFSGEFANATEEKVVKALWTDESRRYIWMMRLYLGGGTKLGDSFFDNIRKTVVGLATSLPNTMSRLQGPEKLAEIQRWLFALYIEGLVNSAKGNKEVDTQIRGIAWSLLAKDAKGALKERGQTIDGNWLFDTAGPLIQRGHDPKALKQELSRFTHGDPQVIRVEQPSSP